MGARASKAQMLDGFRPANTEQQTEHNTVEMRTFNLQNTKYKEGVSPEVKLCYLRDLGLNSDSTIQICAPTAKQPSFGNIPRGHTVSDWMTSSNLPSKAWFVVGVAMLCSLRVGVLAFRSLNSARSGGRRGLKSKRCL